MNGGMHYRFIKRFLASTVVFVFFGVFLVSRWKQGDPGVKSLGLMEDENTHLTTKEKPPLPGDSDEIESYSSRSKRFDVIESSESWIQDVLEKNLTNEEAVEELLKEVDKERNEDEFSNVNDKTEQVHSRPTEPITSATAPLSPTGRLDGTKPYRRKRRKRKRPSAILAGFLNVHIWRGWCGSTVEDLRRNKHFPLYPDGRTVTTDFYERYPEVSYGQRIFGFIHPPRTGNFTFYISSDDNSELWLSNSSNPNHIRKIAWGGNRTQHFRASVAEFDVSKTQKSDKIYLVKGKMYFIEALHKQRAFSNHVLVAWKGPGISKKRVIGSAYVSAYFDENELSSDVNILAQYIPETKASYPTHHHGTLEVNPHRLKSTSKFGADDERDHFHLRPSVDESDTEGLLPKCEYRPSYVVDFDVNRYEGVTLIHETAIYPDDKTELTHMIPLSDCQIRGADSHGNRLSSFPGTDDSPLQPTDLSSEDNDVTDNTVLKEDAGKSSSNTVGSFTIGSNFNSLIAKLKSKFKDFDSYIKSNANIFGGRGKALKVRPELSENKKDRVLSAQDRTESSLIAEKEETDFKSKEEDGEKSLPVDQPKRQERKRTARTTEARKFVGAKRKSKIAKKHSKHQSSEGSDGSHIEKQKDRKVKRIIHRNKGEDGAEINSKHVLENHHKNSVQDRTNKHGVVKGKRGSVKRTHSKYGVREVGHFRNKKIVETLNAGNHQNDIVNNSRTSVKYEKGNIPRATSKMDDSSKSVLKADGGYMATFYGRKLLSTDEKEVVFAYETDDEGLPSSVNGFKREKPIYPPIEGVANEKMPLKKVVWINRNQKLDNDEAGGTSDDSSNSAESFKLNSAYRKLNITSTSDVLKNFRIFRYALYDMTREEPRRLSWVYHQDKTECKADGNLRLNEQVAKSIVFKYMRELKKRHKDKYSLKKIINVEENHDVVKGDRYLIELDLKMKGQGDKSFRLSKYVYQKIGDTNLCEPMGFQWNLHTTVHVIVPVKNQGRWVQHFIDNMEQIYLETLDSHLNVIIVDFNSTDIDIEKSLKNSKLKRYKLIKLNGPFQRALGIQAGADSVENSHDIIFTCDLHLEIPSALIDNIRKHCIEGKMAFAPIVVRLDCGYLPDNPYGLWELQGYGLFAICKSDFDKAGGMNTKEFKTKWGGEDWEMLDRILSNNLEVERLRVPKFYHYYHTKVGMWSKT